MSYNYDLGGVDLIVNSISTGASAPGTAGTKLTDIANAVTTDQVQTITGVKTFSGATTTFAPGLIIESAADALTAHAGGGQGSALALTKEINRITTVATAGDSVSLPASVAGLDVMIINSGANPMQVYGAGTDTINDVATATGVTQMPGSECIYGCSVAGKWYCNGLGTGFSGSLETMSYADGLTAHAGGGQGSALALTSMMNRVTTVGTGNDSVVLPTAVPGLSIVVINAAASNSMNVFPASGDAINALSANAAFAVAANKVATFYSTAAGHWHSILSA